MLRKKGKKMDYIEILKKYNFKYQKTPKGIKVFLEKNIKNDWLKELGLSRSTIWRARNRGYFYLNYHVVKKEPLNEQTQVPESILLAIYNFAFYKAIRLLYSNGINYETVTFLKNDLAHDAYLYFLEKTGKILKETEGDLNRFKKLSFEVVNKKMRALLRDNRFYRKYMKNTTGYLFKKEIEAVAYKKE